MSDLQDKERIQSLLMIATSAELELVWLPKILSNQTDDEIKERRTIKENKVGLNGSDAPIVTSIYSGIRAGRHLSDGQARYLRKVLPKYWRQYSKMGVKNG